MSCKACVLNLSQVLKHPKKVRAPIDKAASYLLKNAPYLRYDQYLKKGWPIATGVIEGACRFLIKDRMDVTGARWTLEGAEAVVKIRSLKVSNHFDDYWKFHEDQEFLRNHHKLYKNPEIIAAMRDKIGSSTLESEIKT